MIKKAILALLLLMPFAGVTSVARANDGSLADVLDAVKIPLCIPCR